MISWLLIAILAYLFFSFSFLADKLVLSGPPNPKLYTFYVAILGLLGTPLLFFISPTFPSTVAWGWIMVEALVYLAGLYTMFLVLHNSEVSRVMTTIGALQPVMIFFFSFLLWGEQIISKTNLVAFFLLVVGGILISLGGTIKRNRNYVILIVFSSMMFSLDYVFSKMVFLHVPFLEGILLMRVVSALLAMVILFDRDVRAQIFTKKPSLGRKNGTIFLFGQMSGGLAGFLQSLSIALAPVSFLAIISSLRGVQYVFLFFMTLFFSYFFPKALKEEISWKIILQKSVSIVFIVIGLALLV
jgi:drug/metabolite transporter (DMT)-like permease